MRISGKLHHIGTGRDHARTPVLMLVRDLRVRPGRESARSGQLTDRFGRYGARNGEVARRPPCGPPRVSDGAAAGPAAPQAPRLI